MTSQVGLGVAQPNKLFVIHNPPKPLYRLLDSHFSPDAKSTDAEGFVVQDFVYVGTPF
jgi:hypothetical protein